MTSVRVEVVNPELNKMLIEACGAMPPFTAFSVELSPKKKEGKKVYVVALIDSRGVYYGRFPENCLRPANESDLL